MFENQSSGPANYITPPTLVSAYRMSRQLAIRFGVLVLSSSLWGGGLACGPDLTTPSRKDISGNWSSQDKVGAVSNISITLTQSADGILAGEWSGTLSPPDAPCPPDLSASPTGGVTGTNTIFEVRFDIMGVGIFQGQLVDPHTLRGSLQSCELIFSVTFVQR